MADLGQSLSNFTCKLCMIRGVTLLILGLEVKGQGQLSNWQSVYKTLRQDRDYSLRPITFKLRMQVVDDEMTNHFDSGLLGQRSRSTVVL